MPENEITGSFFRIREDEPAFTNLLIETYGTLVVKGVYSEIYYPGLSPRLATIIGVFLKGFLNFTMLWFLHIQ